MGSICTEMILSEINDSNGTVDESLCSNVFVEIFSGSEPTDDGYATLQCDIQRILQEHIDNIIKKWGNSEQWILEL